MKKLKDPEEGLRRFFAPLAPLGEKLGPVVFQLPPRWRADLGRLAADFAYVRLHGPGGPYQGSYDDAALAAWAERVLAWRAVGVSTYCYFDNDDSGHAPRDALRLARLVRAA